MIKRIFSLFLLAVMTTCYTVAPFASSLAYGSTAAVYSTSAGYENLVPKKLEASMKDVAPGMRFQFERTGYFISDPKEHSAEKAVYNRIVSLRDSYSQ